MNDLNRGRRAEAARTRRSRRRAALLCGALLCLAAGCSSGPASSSGGAANTAQTNLLVTDTAPAGVSLLAFEVTVSSAVLDPGGVQLLSAPVTVEVTRLQTETELLSDIGVAPGTYTSLVLTFTNPSLTFKNDTGSTLAVGSVNCAAGAICTASPAIAASGGTGTVTLPGSGVTLTANTPAALLLDLNLANIFSNTVQANFLAASSVSQVTPVSGAPFATLDDVVGVVGAEGSDSVGSYFTLDTSLGDYTVHVSTGASPTVYSNFPVSSQCSTPAYACLAAGQIVSVDMSSFASTGLMASDIFFEDANDSQPEVEGLMVATSGLASPAQFEMVVLAETPTVSGLPIGSLINVALNNSPATVFDVDNLGASAVTANYSFQNAADVIVGQEVQVQELAGSTTSLITAGRIRLRSSRYTANVSTTEFPNFIVDDLPSFFGDAGISQLQIDTGAFTAVGGTVDAIDQLTINRTVSFRAQLFANGSTPVGVATEVIAH